MNHKKLKRRLQNKPVTLTAKEVDRLKREATDNATEIVNLIPLLILRDKFGFGKVRLCRYLEFFNETLEAYNEGRFDLKDIEQVLLDEVKIGFRSVDESKGVEE
mgnify:CR=1 FL=1